MTTTILKSIKAILNKTNVLPNGIDMDTRLILIDAKADCYQYWGHKHAEGNQNYDNSAVALKFEHSMVEKPFWIVLFNGAQYRKTGVQFIRAFWELPQISDAIYVENSIDENDTEDGIETILDIAAKFDTLWFYGDDEGKEGSIIDGDSEAISNLANAVLGCNNLIINLSIPLDEVQSFHIEQIENALKLARESLTESIEAKMSTSSFYAVLSDDADATTNKISYLAAGKTKDGLFSGLIIADDGYGNNVERFVANNEFLPHNYGGENNDEFGNGDMAIQMLNLAMKNNSFFKDCDEAIEQYLDYDLDSYRYILKKEFISLVHDGVLKIGENFKPITVEKNEFLNGSIKALDMKEFADKYIDFKELIKNQFELVMVQDLENELDSNQIIAKAIAELEGTELFSEVINVDEVRKYISSIIECIEESKDAVIGNTSIIQCEVCIDCGTVCLPDDECYSKHDGEALCDRCSFECSDCEKYYSENEGNFNDDDGSFCCKNCAKTTMYPKSIVIDGISEGSDIVIGLLEESGCIIGVDDILAYDTEEHIVFYDKEKIKEAINTLPTQTIDAFSGIYLERKELVDTDDLMHDITVTVMKILNSDAIAFFMDLNDFIQSELIDRVEKIEEEKKEKMIEELTDNDINDIKQSMQHEDYSFLNDILRGNGFTQYEKMTPEELLSEYEEMTASKENLTN